MAFVEDVEGGADEYEFVGGGTLVRKATVENTAVMKGLMTTEENSPLNHRQHNTHSPRHDWRLIQRLVKVLPVWSNHQYGCACPREDKDDIGCSAKEEERF